MLGREATLGEEINVSTMPGSDRRPGTWSQFGRWGPAAAAGVIVVASAFVLLFQIAGFQRYVLDSWMDSLHRRSGIRMEMVGFSWNWPFRLIIDEAEMHFNGSKLLHCQKATLTLSPLLRRPFWYVEDLILDHPIFYLEKDSRGRWHNPSSASIGRGTAGRSRHEDPVREPSLSITIHVRSGTIVAEQDGRQVLRVGDVSGKLTLPYDGGVGMGSLLANLERLRSAGPHALSLRGGNAGPGQGAAP